MSTGDTAIRKCFTEIKSRLGMTEQEKVAAVDHDAEILTNRTGEYLKVHADIEHQADECLVPGGIIAEFSDPFDANLFRRMKGASLHTVTAGIAHPFAVRKLIKEPA